MTILAGRLVTGCDVLVAGRGPAGSVAALTLARRGLDVILVAPEDTPARRIGATLPAIGRRWIAVGDAALSFDPLSSQGLLTALYTGWKGAEATAAGLAGDMGPLEEYARRLDATRSRYLQQRALAYAEVTRYATHPFWSTRRRHPAYPTAAE